MQGGFCHTEASKVLLPQFPILENKLALNSNYQAMVEVTATTSPAFLLMTNDILKPAFLFPISPEVL